MAKVMIKCPDTGDLVFTGVLADQAMLERAQIRKNKMARCSACGKDHSWTKEQAVLQDWLISEGSSRRRSRPAAVLVQTTVDSVPGWRTLRALGTASS